MSNSYLIIIASFSVVLLLIMGKIFSLITRRLTATNLLLFLLGVSFSMINFFASLSNYGNTILVKKVSYWGALYSSLAFLGIGAISFLFVIVKFIRKLL